ncbi:MAG: hypothetical protein ABSC93_25910 [Bryobacteraceae bacterium]|jgi:hypothetical protein
MAWNHLVSEADVDHLLHDFGGFHDGCLREAHVWTGHWVAEDLHMHCTGELDTRVRLLIQRQFSAPSAIELLFEEVTTFHLQPSPRNYDSIIFGATMLLDGDTFYWADLGGWSPAASERDHATWIAAKKVSWRDASDWMGPDLRYGTHA